MFITDFTILFQSTHFTRAAKGQEIQADLRSYQLTPPAPPLPLPLLFPQCGWKQVLMENYFLILLQSMTLLSQYAAPLSLSNATQPSHSIFLFFSSTLAPCFCATSLNMKSLSLAHAPPSCRHSVSPLCSSTSYISTGTDFNFSQGFKPSLHQKPYVTEAQSTSRPVNQSTSQPVNQVRLVVEKRTNGRSPM